MSNKAFDEPEFLAQLTDAINRRDEDSFFRKVCDKLLEDEEATVADMTESDSEVKCGHVTATKEYFLKIEEYERCAALQRIVDRVLNSLNK